MTPEDLGRLFESFSSSAFRLECLPAYAVTEDDEAEAFQRFLNGNPAPSWWTGHRAWFTTVRDAVARGATVQRVRCVYGPLTEYEHFQFAWSYPFNERAGEQIFVMNTGPGVFGSLSRYEHDWWLFDDVTVVRLDYDDDGNFRGLEAIEEAEPYRRTRNFTLANAVPFQQYPPLLHGPERDTTGKLW